MIAVFLPRRLVGFVRGVCVGRLFPPCTGGTIGLFRGLLGSGFFRLFRNIFIFRILKGIHGGILLVCFCQNHKKYL
jgi:uncharacterized membrane protein YraQ (UPF0718 family)